MARLPLTPARRLAAAALLSLGLVAMGCGSTSSTATTVSTAATAQPVGATDIGAGLRGPSGLTATTYATGLPNAAAFAFDSTGRLWVGTASIDDDGTDAVSLVTSAGAAPTKVITDIHTPLGLLWIGDELFVSSKSQVTAYSGFDGTTFAAKRVVVQFAAGVGELNGLALSPGGRLVLGISAPCNACVPTTQYSASIVSFLPDGSDLQVYANGIRAGVGLAFYPGTDTLFVTMNQRDDLEDTPGDWLSVVTQGQSWGSPDCYGQGGEECSTQPAPVAALDAHAAVSGVAIVTGQLGATVGTAAVVAEWTRGAVLAVPLDRSDPATASTPSTFVTGLTSPEPVALGPDGALYIGDWATGTVYRVTGATTGAAAVVPAAVAT